MTKDENKWPLSRLECLSIESKNTVSSKICCNYVEASGKTLVSFSRFFN